MKLETVTGELRQSRAPGGVRRFLSGPAVGVSPLTAPAQIPEARRVLSPTAASHYSEPRHWKRWEQSVSVFASVFGFVHAPDFFFPPGPVAQRLVALLLSVEIYSQ